MKKLISKKILITLVFIAIIVASVPSLWQIYLWSIFPAYNIERFTDIQVKNGIGQECSTLNISGNVPNSTAIKACFAHGNLIQNQIMSSSQPGSEMAITSYGCQGAGFYAESYYISYSTTEYYQCMYKTAIKKEDIPEFKNGEIDAYSPYPATFITKFFLRIFGLPSKEAN